MRSSPITLCPSDRGALIGANGTGKSTLGAYLLNAFHAMVADSRILVLDTKPRWRAEYTADGRRANRLYKQFAKGDTLPGSYALSEWSDWDLVWDRDLNPSQIVIVQRLDATLAHNLPFQIAVAERFFKSQSARRPSLIYYDEGMDFFTPTATARGGSDIVQRCFRAGREKGLASLIGAQRPIGINLQCLTELNYLALFRINYLRDMRRLHEMGWPEKVRPPTYEQSHTFRLWREGAPRAPLYRLVKAQHSSSLLSSRESVRAS